MAEMDLPTSARSHNGPKLHVREHHQRRKLAARINSIPHERPAEIRAQGATFALLHGEYTWGFSAHGHQTAQWQLQVRVLIGRRGMLACRESRPSREDPLLALM